MPTDRVFRVTWFVSGSDTSYSRIFDQMEFSQAVYNIACMDDVEYIIVTETPSRLDWKCF